MIARYFDFINENIELLLESDVKYSEKFRKILKKIGDPVSNKLLELENQDHPVQSNYFDITDTNDTISFTPDRKVKEILDKNKNMWRYATPGRYLSSEGKYQYLWDALEIEREEIQEPPTNTLGTIGKEAVSPASGKKFVVFIPNDKSLKPIPVNAEALKLGGEGTEDFFNISRQSIRVGRGVRAILNSAKVKLSDKEIEDFVNKYKATIDSINDIFSNFEIVTGDDISYWYNYERYEKGTDRGTLGQSCMADVPDSFLEIYCANPDKISLVIYKVPEDPQKIRGRALVWKLNDGKFFMDRIYTHEDSDVELFRQFAKKQGWYSKKYNSSTSSGISYKPDGSGDTENLTLEVSVKGGKYDKYPYLDTLKYYNPSKGLIKNHKDDGDYELEDTDGGYISCDTCGGSGRVTCEYCNGDGERECSRCDGDGERECRECDGSGVIPCDECDNGKIKDDDGNEKDCPTCNGSGDRECPECDGRGKYECPECDGRGSWDCDECSDGYVDCPDCQ